MDKKDKEIKTDLDKLHDDNRILPGAVAGSILGGKRLVRGAARKTQKKN